jgi:hypothetical protein
MRLECPADQFQTHAWKTSTGDSPKMTDQIPNAETIKISWAPSDHGLVSSLVARTLVRMRFPDLLDKLIV